MLMHRMTPAGGGYLLCMECAVFGWLRVLVERSKTVENVRRRWTQGWLPAATLVVALFSSVSAQPSGEAWFEIVATGSVAEVAAALAAGADVHERDTDGWSVVAVAAALSVIPEVVEALIGAGGDIQQRFGGSDSTPLMAAAGSTPNVDVVNALIQAGADVHARNNAGATALHAALAWSPYRYIRRYFFDTPTVEALAADGPFLTLATPLEPDVRVVAVELYLPDLGFGFTSGVAAIESDGALLRLERPLPFPPSLEEIVLVVPRVVWPEATSATSALAIAQVLVDAGAEVDVRDNWGVTPLMQAAVFGQQGGAEFLLGLGADIAARSNNGETVLHRAANAAMARLLLEHGAQLDVRTLDGATALHTAVSRDDAELVRVLIELGSDSDAKRASGSTPLTDAVRFASPETIEALLDGGADPNASDGGVSAVVAIARSNERLIDRDTGAVLHPVFWRLHDAQYR